jgi:hypothetical protein
MANEGGHDDISGKFADFKRGAEEVEKKKREEMWDKAEAELLNPENQVKMEGSLFVMNVEETVKDGLTDEEIEQIEENSNIDSKLRAKCETILEEMIVEKRRHLNEDETTAPENKEHMWQLFIGAMKFELERYPGIGVSRFILDYFTKKGWL